MPATEQTWRDLKKMHLWFGITAVLMLLGTIWMLAADHMRSWKEYQREFRKVQAWTTAARIQDLETADYERKDTELRGKLADAEMAVPARGLIDQFLTEMRAAPAAEQDKASIDANVKKIDERYQALASEPSAAKQTALVDELETVIRNARNAENRAAGKMKFRRADLDVARSNYELAISTGKPQADQNRLQADLDAVKGDVTQLTEDYQDKQTYRKNLEAVLKQITAPKADATKALTDHEKAIDQLTKTEQQFEPGLGAKLLELPIIDAFGRPLKIDQIWLPKLTINYNFRDVARFDRCNTCHQGIALTAPGSATAPLYPHEVEMTFEMATPSEPVDVAAGGEAEAGKADEAKPNTTTPPKGNIDEQIQQAFGLKLRERSESKGEIAVEVVLPNSSASKANRVNSGSKPELVAMNPPGSVPETPSVEFQSPPGLRPGDVIVQLNDVKIDEMNAAQNFLLSELNWGSPLRVKVRRGASHPFSSHPRLDLFVGSTSPHKMQEMGCTVCHDGQGSATSFQWASHTPNSIDQQEEWKTKYGWERNHHWIYPMFPNRFAESTCLKCHHDVLSLEPSERFPEPPAPKLVEGFQIVQEYGCFGCHEINGYDGPNKRIGPDLRAEPNYSAAAAQLLIDKALTDEERKLAQRLIHSPENRADRQLLAEMIKSDQLPTEPGAKPRLLPASYKLADLIGADDALPGKLRKVGPSLRYVKSKVGFDFLYDWVRNPMHFRPTTKMPRFFGLHDHLLPEEVKDADGKVVSVESKGLEQAERFEPIEIRAIADYLLKNSQSFNYLDVTPGTTASAERGKKLFELRGCLACHQNHDFPQAQANQGPDLSRLAGKLGTDDGKKWLYTWLRQPNSYHARTLMPDVKLEPITTKAAAEGEAPANAEAPAAAGTETSVTTDPAADIVEYLISSSQPWKPDVAPELNGEALNELALEYLSKTFTFAEAQRVLENGIPESRAGELKGDEVALLGPMTPEKKLDYVGRRTIAKYGCSGCHDVPGFETAKPIGTGLADWGRKEPEKLAFELIDQYIAQVHGGGHASVHGGDVHGGDAHSGEVEETPLGEPAPDAGTVAGLAAIDSDSGDDLLEEELLHHHREGFLWQKLRAPRSYDYKKTQNKDYNERLRMPKFNFTPQQIEAVMTFVLGLLSEPPAQQFVYRPDQRQQAILDGRHVIEKYNCGGCHQLELAKWEFQFDPKTFPEPPAFDSFDFVKAHFTPKELEDSKKTDRRGMATATVAGMPEVDTEGKLMADEDDEGKPLHYFTLWQNTPINGQPWLVSNQLSVSEPNMLQQQPPLGGYLARLIYPTVLADAASTSNVKPSDAWGWVPPPLVGEGKKVQTAWLNDFLLDPYPIRPATVLRMPKFNFSADEVTKLVNYFAAVDRAEYPYEFDPRTQTSYLAEREAQHPNRLQDALKIVTNGDYCIKCHYVGDFAPEGVAQGHAPNLDRVYQRIRPEYLVNWIAKPQSKLPYTGMPVNFPPDKPASQELFKGSSQEQIEAIVDLLLNYDSFMKNKTSIKPLIQKTAPATPPVGGE